MDDATLLEAIGQRRDTSAFEELCRRYATKLRRYVAGRGVGDAESIVQEVMLVVWRRADRFDPGRASVATWLYTIARNRATDALRKRGRPVPDPRDPAFVATQARAPDPAPDAATARHQQIAAIRYAMTHLPAEQRALLNRVYIDGQTIAEAARAMNVPLGTAKSRLRLALASVRNQLSVSHG